MGNLGAGIIWLAAALVFAAYIRGRVRLRLLTPRMAAPVRLFALAAGLLLICAALAWPLPALSQTHVLARTAQKVAVCFVGAPLLWLACPWQVMVWGAPHALRHRLTSALVRPSRWTPLLAALGNPFFVWFFYLSAVVLWDDPAFVNWSMQSVARQQTALVLLLAAALLFWQQITLCGPRRVPRTPLLGRFAMLVGVEIPNVAAGITITFQNAPLYDFYAQQGITYAASTLNQQSLSGALTWVFGSLVYVGSIVMVVNEVFKREGVDRPQPPANWDDEARFIAPGLEERLTEPGHTRHNWRDH